VSTRARWREERGAGAVLAIAVLGALAAWTVLAITAMTVYPASQRVANAADAAALAAADVVSGAVTGVACEVAARAADLNGANLGACELEGPVASVRASVDWLAFRITAEARAGPPGWD
jgi:secretion/DNA translocation related TadE-like protein